MVVYVSIYSIRVNCRCQLFYIQIVPNHPKQLLQQMYTKFMFQCQVQQNSYNIIMSTKNAENYPYFETQGNFTLQCGMHSVNNLIGSNIYDTKKMEQLCYSLSGQFINPHKHIFGGDYDVNVLIQALQKQGFEIKWHDKRKQISISDNQNSVGFLVNVRRKTYFYHQLFNISGRHWMTIKKNKIFYYLLDSAKDNPIKIGTQQQAIKFLNDYRQDQAEILIVSKKNI